MSEPATLGAVARWIVSDPWDAIGRRWNYKSAVMSAVTRSQVFFVVNLSAGLDAAVAALVTELVFRGATAGFYGALTQAFRRVQPPFTGMAAAMIVVPAVAHGLEFLVHWWRGTAELARSIEVSIAFTVLSTSFNLFAMRRGALIVGKDSGSLAADLCAVPRLLVAFAAGGLRAWRTSER